MYEKALGQEYTAHTTVEYCPVRIDGDLFRVGSCLKEVKEFAFLWHLHSLDMLHPPKRAQGSCVKQYSGVQIETGGARYALDGGVPVAGALFPLMRDTQIRSASAQQPARLRGC